MGVIKLIGKAKREVEEERATCEGKCVVFFSADLDQWALADPQTLPEEITSDAVLARMADGMGVYVPRLKLWYCALKFQTPPSVVELPVVH